jgi:hypothetical protein
MALYNARNRGTRTKTMVGENPMSCWPVEVGDECLKGKGGSKDGDEDSTESDDDGDCKEHVEFALPPRVAWFVLGTTLLDAERIAWAKSEAQGLFADAPPLDEKRGPEGDEDGVGRGEREEEVVGKDAEGCWQSEEGRV